MKFSLTEKPLENFAAECIVLPVYENEPCRFVHIEKSLMLANFDRKVGSVWLLTNVENFQAKCVLAAGFGAGKISRADYQKLLQTVIETLNAHQFKNALFPIVAVAGDDEDWTLRLSVQILKDAIYRPPKVGAKTDAEATIEHMIFQSSADEKNLHFGEATAEAIALTRELGDLPANVCTPDYLAETAKKLAADYDLNCEILDEDQMTKLGMHALLSVSRGSAEPARLIHLSHQGRDNDAPIVLIGKGVTFDSGGISIKPSTALDEMKYDMSGAAAVLGVMLAVAKLGAAVNVSVIVPAVENMPAHNATRPGDVVKSMSGQTIEILNTDAEGRLILCDAMTFAEKLKPAVVIDVATLTGAVIVALGRHHSGLFANDQKLADALLKAGEAALDTVWQLPLADAYDDLLKSRFADMANIGGRDAGAVTAACFLARFAKNYRWAHLDVAGTAWRSGEKKGATGRPVALLLEYIFNYFE